MDAKLNPKAAAEAIIAASAEPTAAESGPLLPIAVTVARSMLDLLWACNLMASAMREAQELGCLKIIETAPDQGLFWNLATTAGSLTIAKIEGS